MKKDNIKFLERLLNSATPSGNEIEGMILFEDQMDPISKFLFNDNINNSVFYKGASPELATTKVLISGHIDSISMLVTNITDSGLLNVMSGGGMDRKVLPGSKVTVLSDDKDTNGICKRYTGVIGKKPIHIEYDTKEYNEVTNFENIEIYLGYSSKKEVEDLGIHVGSQVIYERGNSNLNFGKDDNLICSPDLDDKIGVYITEEIIRRIDEHSLKLNGVSLIGAAMTQEEVGLRGSRVAASRIDPNISIDIDVTFDTEDFGISKATYGDISIGKGPVIEIGADKNRKIVKDMISLAKNKNIPYQLNATMPGGTNTHAIQMSSTDCATMHIAIPLKNMHTPVEIINWNDVENCINLIVEYINSKITF